MGSNCKAYGVYKKKRSLWKVYEKSFIRIRDLKETKHIFFLNIPNFRKQQKKA